MIPTNENNKSLAIYAHYDSGESIDQHVIYQLTALHDYGIKIIFVSNSPVSNPESLTAITEKIVLRADEGYDWFAWREVILSFSPQDFNSLDSLIIINSSCYGPFFPLEEMFATMANKECDFWGITENTDPSYPDHIQPYFCVFKHSLLQSDCFINFWNELHGIKDYYSAIHQGELKMTRYFNNHGFTHAVYANIPSMNCVPEIGVEHPFIFTAAAWMIHSYRVPFIKVKAFRTAFGKQYNMGTELFIELKKSGSNYPEQLILNHLRRTQPLSWQKNLPDTLQVLPIDGPVLPNPGLKIAVFAHLFYKDQVEEALSWIAHIPYAFDLYISTSSEATARYIRNKTSTMAWQAPVHVEIRITEDRGRDVAPWLLAFRDVHDNYDIALKFHIKKRPEPNPVFVWEWNNFLMQSLLASSAYISQIVNLFKKSESLGMVFHIFPPVLTLYIHQQDSIKETMEWKQKILELLDITLPSETSLSIYPNNFFWYRPQALAKLIHSDIKLTDFPEEPFPSDGTIAHGMERAIPYVAQSAGYHYKLVVPTKLLPVLFQHYEDHILHLELHGYSRPQASVQTNSSIPSNTHSPLTASQRGRSRMTQKYCKIPPNHIPIGRALQIATFSFCGLLQRIFTKITAGNH